MIVVDTSALMAVLLREAEAGRCRAVLKAEPELLISAATLAEALIVAGRRDLKGEMADLVEGLGFDVVAVTAASARNTAAAYDLWEKGVHPAKLNLGDCFAYALARENDCPLLFVGDDFSKTDVKVSL